MESGNGDSSEGIVASSDDEVDALSKAVEYHIFSQESSHGERDAVQPDIGYRERSHGKHFVDGSQMRYDRGSSESWRTSSPFREERNRQQYTDYQQSMISSGHSSTWWDRPMVSHREHGVVPRSERPQDVGGFRRYPDLYSVQKSRPTTPPRHDRYGSQRASGVMYANDAVARRYRDDPPHDKYLQHPSVDPFRQLPVISYHSSERRAFSPPRHEPSRPEINRLPQDRTHSRSPPSSNWPPARGRSPPTVQPTLLPPPLNVAPSRSMQESRFEPQPGYLNDPRPRTPPRIAPPANSADGFASRYSHTTAGLFSSHGKPYPPVSENGKQHEAYSYKNEKALLDVVNRMRMKKSPPKPVLFKIKPKKSETKPFHPLDPLSPAVWSKMSRNSSPERWSHDRYKSESRSDVTSNKKGVSKKQIKNDMIGSLQNEQENETETNVPVESVTEETRQPNEPDASSSAVNSVPSVEEAPDGLIHAERGDDTIYEEEEILIADDAELENVVNTSSDDDEELLGLRLKALTSALHTDKKPKSASKHGRRKTMSRKKRLKTLIHRVHDTPEKQVPRSRSGRSKSANLFLEKYSPISKRSSEKPRLVGVKASPTQLTLLGEMVRNNHPTKMEALRLIRDMTDSQKKTSMFLKLVAKDAIDESHATELLKQRMKKSKAEKKIVSDSGPKETKENENPPMGDNYDEMEMDLDMDDEDSDSNLVPPGTDSAPIELPNKDLNSQPTTYVPAETETTNDDDTPKITTAPSQESIWNMLEQPIQSQPNENEITPPGDDQWQAAEKVQIVSRRRSWEDYEDDDAILELRQSLLRQLKNTTDATEYEFSMNAESLGDNPPGISDRESPALPSQFPYQPPKMTTNKSPILVTSATSVLMSTPSPIVSVPIVTVLPVVTVSTAVTTTSSVNVPVTTSPLPSQAPPNVVKTTPRTVLYDTNISSKPSAHDLSIGTPQVFQPKIVSTPAVTPQTPLTQNKPRRLRKRKQSQSKMIQQTLKTENLKTVEQPKTNVLKPTVTNVTSTPSKLVKPSETTATSSQTLVKTATTLIKTNVAGSKRTSPFSSNSNIALKKAQIGQSETVSEKLQMRLPRHQPVVINIGSSDEEESIISPKRQNAIISKNPLQIQTDILNEMIERVRSQTTAKQNLHANSQSGAKTAPKVSHVKKMQNASKVESKSPAQVEKPSKQTSNQSNEEILKRNRMKFVKLKSLIQKDEMNFNRVSKIREAKKSELKVVTDELNEMIHRVNAIKGKKARCLELVKRYGQQEMKIKDRLQKRSALKGKLEEHIKNMWLKVRAEKRARKRQLELSDLAKKNQSMIGTDNVTSNIKRVDQEKQRLLAMEQKLAAKISEMKKMEGPQPISKARKRSSLSKEVQSHLESYRTARRSSNPSAHDLSLNKITLSASSPVRPPGSRLKVAAVHEKSPVKRAIINPVDSIRTGKTPEKTVSSSQSGSKNSQQKWESDAPKTAVSESTLKLRKSLLDSMVNFKAFQSLENQAPFEDVPFAIKVWERKIPGCFKTWKLDVCEMPSNRRAENRERKSVEMKYESPLRIFRSYRLNPFLRMKEKLAVKSNTFSHKINPRQILCRYDLTGTCQDPDCRGQHATQYQLTSEELVMDLLLYCPSLLGKEANSETKYETLLSMAQSVSDKLLGYSSTRNRMSIDEKCIFIISKVNSMLGNKAPFTTIFKPRSIKLKQNEEPWIAPVTVQPDKVTTEDEPNVDSTAEHSDATLSKDERYFAEPNAPHPSMLEVAVKENPQNVQMWLELAETNMKKPGANGMDLALHTMCLALEENPYSGELWAQYLNLLHDRRASQNGEDLDEMVAQAVDLVPLSTHIWNQLFSWENNTAKMENLFDKLISNLVENLEGEGKSSELSDDVMSRWLLQTVLQKVQLQIYQNDLEDVLSQFWGTVRTFSEQHRWSSAHSAKKCLVSNDLNSLWLSFLNVKHFKCLPYHFVPDVRAADTMKTVLAVRAPAHADVQLSFSSVTKLKEESYTNLLSDINDAIDECKVHDNPTVVCLALLWEKLRLQRAQECWDGAVNSCRIISSCVQDAIAHESLRCDITLAKLKSILTETLMLWADSLAKNGSTEDATQVFEDVINNDSSDARLCFEAALLQLSVDATDIEAVLVYMESCVASFLKTDSECMNASRLNFMLRYLLRLPVRLQDKLPSFVNGVTWREVKNEKVYLWLIYCLLLQISSSAEESIIECYELALDDVENEDGRKELWLRYIRYKQSLAAFISGSGSQLTKGKQIWLKNFSAVVRRCLVTMSPHLPTNDALSGNIRFSDYTFHNQVASIYLSCFHSRQQLTTAYHFLTELMPYNVHLLLRACRYFLRFGDHHSVTSAVWKATSNIKCQNEILWKISISSHFLIGRIAKATRLAKQAVEAVPFSTQLWSDYLTLLKAYGRAEDFVGGKIRCSNLLQTDAARLVKDAQPS